MKVPPLRIQVAPAVGRSLIARSLPRFIHSCPGMRVELHEAEFDGQALGRDVDVGVHVGRYIADVDLAALQIATLKLVTCAAPDCIDAESVPQTPMDLVPESCIGALDPWTHRVREWRFRRGASTHVISPASALAFSDVESAVLAAVSGAGYVRVPCNQAAREIAAGLLRPVLDGWNDERLPVSLVWSREREPGIALDLFVSFIAGLFPTSARTQEVPWVRTSLVRSREAHSAVL